MKKKKLVGSRSKGGATRGAAKKVGVKRAVIVKKKAVARKVVLSKSAPKRAPMKGAKSVASVSESAPTSPKLEETVLAPDVVPPKHDAVSALPTRAPVRKIIRDGKPVPVESPRAASFGAIKEELVAALARANGVDNGAAVRARRFSDFWLAEGVGLPGFLDNDCGSIFAASVDELVTGCCGDGSILRALVESLHRAASAAVEAPPEVEQRRALRATVTVAPTWSSSRAHYPLEARAFLGLVEWQCKLAGAWPFAFARFMSKIPQRLGSDEFLALAGAVDRAVGEVGRAFEWEESQTAALIERGRQQLLGLFEGECPDVHRQWNIALRGAGVVVDQLVQRYVVDSLNREFQLLLGRVLAQAMILVQDDSQGVSRWGASAVA